MKVTAQMHAYLDKHSTVAPEELQTEAGIRRLSFFSNASDYWAEQGYTYIGAAEVTVEVPDLRTIVDNKVAALRTEAVAIRAEASAKVTAIEGRIQNLLAIECSPAATQPATE